MMEREDAVPRRTAVIAIVVVLQLLATIFFVWDAAGDLRARGFYAHIAIEVGAVLALIGGVIFGAMQLRQLLEQAKQNEVAIATARGALSGLLRLRFKQWRLTAAEADVALFALKGCDVADIATLRGAAAGTVKAQLARVYSKAGVRSQVSLMALLVEELVDLGALRSDEKDSPLRLQAQINGK